MENEHQLWDKARRRWKEAEPNTGLTWGLSLDCAGFLSKVMQHAPITAATSILEVGPGYGRFPRSLVPQRIPFRSYLGVDISARNVEHLRRAFDDPRFGFVHGDAETLALDGRFDLFVCTVTIHHFYPDFGALLRNLRRSLSPDARLVFDLHEGTRKYFEPDGVTFIACYSRDEIDGLLRSARLRRTAFDTVVHDAKHQRLLVVAEVPQE